MSDHEHEALDALRRLDGPAELDDGAEDRIEAAVLARFDERIGAGPLDDRRPSTVVALEDATEQTRRHRSNRRSMVLAAAAAAVLVVAGVAVFLSRDEPAPTNPPATTTGSTTDPSAEEAMVTDQLATFCAEYVAPVREADALWTPSGRGSESRQGVLVAVEAAAQAMSELDSPLGDRLADTAQQTLGEAADARLEMTLNSADADDAVSGVRDLLYGAPAAAGISPLPDSCLEPATS